MIEPATDRDLPEIHSLLERLHLPLAGVDDHLATMLVAKEGKEIVGTAAWSCMVTTPCCVPSP
jgi:hypothetical protein